MISDETDHSEIEEPEIIPPSTKDDQGPSIRAEILASIQNYTDRPDLMLEVLEKHDPGFIKSMNEEMREIEQKFRNEKMTFGKYQAYAALFISAISALGVLFALIYSVTTGISGFTTIIALAIFYAVSQGGTKGFLAIIDGFRKLLRKWSDKD